MCVAINGHFKILLGHFFVAGLSGSAKANLIRISLQRIHETGARAVSVTCDGPSSHLTMINELGASLDPENMQPFFDHPSNSAMKVYVFLDFVHMLKLVRNCLASEKIIVSASGMLCSISIV